MIQNPKNICSKKLFILPLLRIQTTGPLVSCGLFAWHIFRYQWRIQDFPDDGDANPWDWGENLIFGKFFAEKYMQMKEIELRRGGGGEARVPKVHLRSANGYIIISEGKT